MHPHTGDLFRMTPPIDSLPYTGEEPQTHTYPDFTGVAQRCVRTNRVIPIKCMRLAHVACRTPCG